MRISFGSIIGQLQNKTGPSRTHQSQNTKPAHGQKQNTEPTFAEKANLAHDTVTFRSEKSDAMFPRYASSFPLIFLNSKGN